LENINRKFKTWIYLKKLGNEQISASDIYALQPQQLIHVGGNRIWIEMDENLYE
jgi:hypothetical protein